MLLKFTVRITSVASESNIRKVIRFFRVIRLIVGFCIDINAYALLIRTIRFK